MNYVARRWIWSRIRQPIWGAACLAALLVVLGGCSLGGGSGSTPPSGELALTQIPWCDSVSINFIDSSSVNQDSITSWSAVSNQLGFTPYLPTTFPKGTCLVLAGGSIHDPIFGGHFVITWNLPGNVPMSFSEAPKRAGLGSSLQCAGSTQQSKTEICLGTEGDTGITIASTESASAIQSLFKALAPNVDWLPAGTDQQQATPSPTTASS
jgi:hypothetical protein